ncbi:MAG: hypothetical protein KIG81_04990 [Thermoguttaceae bacterium]|nr:hypothetical protein [Thermoguttaceae bacterium]
MSPNHDVCRGRKKVLYANKGFSQGIFIRIGIQIFPIIAGWSQTLGE